MSIRFLRVVGSDRNTDLYEVSSEINGVTLMVRLPSDRHFPDSKLVSIDPSNGGMTFENGVTIISYMDANLTSEQIYTRISNMNLLPKAEVLITVRSSSVVLSDHRVIQLDTDIVDHTVMQLCSLKDLCNRTIEAPLTIEQLREILENLCSIWDNVTVVPFDGWFYETLTGIYTPVKYAASDLIEDLLNSDVPDDFYRESETGNVTILLSRNDVAHTWASYLNLVIETCGPMLHKD